MKTTAAVAQIPNGFHSVKPKMHMLLRKPLQHTDFELKSIFLPTIVGTMFGL